jgi:hypothetical protein
MRNHRSLAAGLVVLALVPAAVLADGTGGADVTITEQDCTTEPAPALRLHAWGAGAGRLRVRVLGKGELCGAQWTVRVQGDRVLLDSDPPGPTACGTCEANLLVTGLDPGRYEIGLDGAHTESTVR